jgi:Ca-activated chloride channel family protein
VTTWSAFHFLRPGWLLLLVPVVWVAWRLHHERDHTRQWKRLVTPQLLPHLLIADESRRFRLVPSHLLTGFLLLGVLSLAGPSWQQEPAPFSEDQAALFLVVETTPSMRAQDVQPSRQQRAAQKIDELLKRRPGTRTGLVAYAGSAHLVMPLTNDPGVIRYFAPELEPDIMPVEGDEPAAAVTLATQRIRDSGLAGSVVLITDAVAAEQLPGLEQAHRDSGVPVHVYGIAAPGNVMPPDGSPPAPALDRDALGRAAGSGGGSLVVVTPDDSDLKALNRNLERSIAAAPAGEGQQWKDSGYYLLWPLILLVLPFFRRGGAVAWS